MKIFETYEHDIQKRIELHHVIIHIVNHKGTIMLGIRSRWRTNELCDQKKPAISACAK